MAAIQSPDLLRNAEVDAAMKALRTTIRPAEVLAWNSISERSGAVTGVAANAAVFSFRNIGANPILVRRVGCGYVCTTAYTAAQEVAFGLKVARAFTVSDTVGTAIAITGSNAKHRTSLGTPTSVDCRISAAAALTAGTKTLDTNNLGAVGAWIGAVGAGIVPAPNNLLSHDAGDYPVLLAQNEGFNIMNLVAMGAAGVGTIYASFEFAEVLTF
jgi:hypothetical protein